MTPPTGMPSLDAENRVVGCVAREVPATGYYIRSYLVLDFSTHKLRMYPEESEGSPDPLPLHQVEINCQYITKVKASLARPKSLNSLGTLAIVLDTIYTVIHAQRLLLLVAVISCQWTQWRRGTSGQSH